MLFLNLIVASLLVVLTFSIHFIGLVGLSAGMRRLGGHPSNLKTVFGQGLAILSLVIALFGLHALEIWVYALAYLMLGGLTELEPALYYSSSAFSTVGFGDVALDKNWRMIGAAESLNGFLLIGWSTAFLVSVTARVRVFSAASKHLED